ncbi:MAG: acylneuraminate cytidylyltransferase family protein [Candidatus Omnitrophica bacterium]|nr:acylneuraminate cytidylyltransferase family protein [Candidatus Omnitrophota bacterium]
MAESRILLTVAARGGSKGVKNKNIRELCGKPLIAHTLDQAKRWGRASRIVCSTDSEAIAESARRYGAEVPFLRPAELATDNAGKVGALRHAWRETERLLNERYDVLVDLDATAPVREVADIEGAYQTFMAKRPDSVVSVTPARRNPYFNMLEEQPDGYVALAKRLARPVLRRQDAPRMFDMNASIYVYSRDFLLDDNTISAVQGRTLAWVMDEKSAFDIDTEEDFIFVEYLVAKGLVKL